MNAPQIAAQYFGLFVPPTSPTQPRPRIGIKALHGQYVAEEADEQGNQISVCMAEAINAKRNKYLPGCGKR